jgi:DNA-binding XRE family transcriptional regulator
MQIAADIIAPESSAKQLVLSEEQKKRFWAKVDKNGPLPDQANPHYKGLDQCWVWMAWTDKGPDGGYGKFAVNRRMMRVHRLSWLIAYGTMPNQLVLHKCDVRCCVNPAHLFLGTNADNTLDKVRKGRLNNQFGANHWMHRQPEKILRGNKSPMFGKPSLYRGEKNGGAKLTAEKVREIRELASSRSKNQRDIAKLFNVSQGTINHIMTGRLWKHIH